MLRRWANLGGRSKRGMEIQEHIVKVEHLKLGMFVCRLDRPWEGAPFIMQGFPIETPEQIRKLQALCSEVTIDVIQTRQWQQARLAREAKAAGAKKQISEASRAMSRELLNLADRKVHIDTATVGEEIPRARAAQRHLDAATDDILGSARSGRPLTVRQVDAAVEPVVASVLRSADAMFWLESLRKRSGYEYAHALNCTLLAAAFGRHLGFTEEQMIQLASGGLLLDVGKTQLPQDLLEHPGPLDEEQQALMRTHVELSLHVLTLGQGSRPEVAQMVGAHHERVDGSGYPKGLRGPAIPLYGRIAAIVDSFDAMVSERPYRRAISRHEALQQLYNQRDQLYQAELVERFIQCLGVYPTGSLVELSTGEIAIVQAQNRTRQLLPKVLVLTTADKTLEARFRELDLLVEAAGEGAEIRILRTVEPGAYGLNPSELFL